jgi:hypothetical protein
VERRGAKMREDLRSEYLQESVHVNCSFERIAGNLVAVVNIGKANINRLIDIK